MTSASLHRQSGAVLAVSLFILLIISVLAASTFSGMSSQEKMSGNFREQTLVFQVANSAVQDLFPAMLSTNAGEDVLAVRSRSLPNRYDVDTTGDGVNDRDLDVDLEICFAGVEAAPGSDEDYKAYSFEVSANSTTGRGASATVRQAGFVIVEASDQVLPTSCGAP